MAIVVAMQMTFLAPRSRINDPHAQQDFGDLLAHLKRVALQ
jgi:hypothetical protein